MFPVVFCDIMIDKRYIKVNSVFPVKVKTFAKRLHCVIMQKYCAQISLYI